MSRDASTVTDLFLEYLRAHEEHVAPDEESLLSRAGARSEELRNRIDLFESVQGLAARLRDSKLEGTGRFGRFDIVELIAEGGMGTVFLAHDPDLERRVALKILHPLVLGGRSSRDMILNEARSLARLEHPGVVRVIEIGHAEERDHVVMEHVPGPSLARVIEELRALNDPPRAEDPGDVTAAAPAARIARSLRTQEARIACLARIAEALAYCHRCGVVHRDVKPANVLFGDANQPVLIDFGLAHLADASGGADLTQRLVGTPAYLAPEQVESGRTGRDPRSDQFSFGVLAYELLTLAQPFQRESRTATLDAVAAARPERPTRLAPDLPRDVEQIVVHALQARPAERYPGLAELADDLRAVLEDRPVSIAPPSIPRRARLWLRRNRVPVAAATAGLVLVLGTWLASSFADAKRRADAVRARLARIAVEGLEGPKEIQEVGRELEELSTESAALDRSVLRFLGGGPGREVRRRTQAWSRRFRGLLARDLAEADASGAEFQLPLAWSRVIDVERDVLPDVDDAEGFRDRGKVFLPDPLPEDVEVVLYQQVPVVSPERPDAPLTSFHEVPFENELVPGVYRLQAWPLRAPVTAAPAYQLEFVVTSEWGPALHLELRPPATWLEETLVPVPRQQRGGAVVPAFRISPRPVTRGELQDFLNAMGRPAPDTFELGTDLEGPAWCDQATAIEYARWCGARLPTAIELDVAMGFGLVDLTQAAQTCHSEWVSDTAPDLGPESASMFRYELYERYCRGGDPIVVTLASCLVSVRRAAGVIAGASRGACFRITFSNDVRGVY